MATLAELATHLDMTVRRVTALKNEGVFPPGKKGLGMDIDECRVKYIKYLRDLGRKQPLKPVSRGAPDEESDEDPEGYSAMKIRDLKAAAELKEIKGAQLRKELASVSVITWTLSRVSSQINSILDSIPVKVKRRIPSMTTAQIDIIKKEVVLAQNAASEINVDFSDYGGPVDTAESSLEGP